ncbi:MAG: hypothetical protein ACM3OC_06905 [Deltaproteobacteria bacterium]
MKILPGNVLQTGMADTIGRGKSADESGREGIRLVFPLKPRQNGICWRKKGL